MKVLLEYLKKTGSSYVAVLGTLVTILLVLIRDRIILMSIIFIPLLIACLFIHLASLEYFPHDKRIKNQWDLFGLLLERHRQLMKKYYYWALIMLFLIFLFFTKILCFNREELICLIRQYWWGILIYLFFIFGIYAYYLWKYVFVVMDYHLVQILWEQIEELRDELEIKNMGGLKDNLDEYGTQKLYYLMLKLRDGEMPKDFSREEIENIIDAEATIIEQIKVKAESSDWPSYWGKIYYNFKRSI